MSAPRTPTSFNKRMYLGFSAKLIGMMNYLLHPHQQALIKFVTRFVILIKEFVWDLSRRPRKLRLARFLGRLGRLTALRYSSSPHKIACALLRGPLFDKGIIRYTRTLLVLTKFVWDSPRRPRKLRLARFLGRLGRLTTLRYSLRLGHASLPYGRGLVVCCRGEHCSSVQKQSNFTRRAY